jgi:hypothetical protein
MKNEYYSFIKFPNRFYHLELKGNQVRILSGPATVIEELLLFIPLGIIPEKEEVKL